MRLPAVVFSGQDMDRGNGNVDINYGLTTKLYRITHDQNPSVGCVLVPVFKL